MDIYLNDFSLYSDKDILSNWSAIEKFYVLIQKLAEVSHLHFKGPKELWNIPISGFNVMTGNRSDKSNIPKDHCSFLRAIYAKFSLINNESPHFAEEVGMNTPSCTMGLAFHQSVPVISFTFDDKYKKDLLTGWFRYIENDIIEAKLKNLFEDKPSNYEFIADLTPCKRLDPLKEPMWNKELVKKILENVNFVDEDCKTRQALLIKYGKIVAEVNGWTYNEKISKLNSNSGQLRYIYDSSLSFLDYPIAYLSLDMEGPDLAFELCNKKGSHLGECSWNGSRKDRKMHHDILVK